MAADSDGDQQNNNQCSSTLKAVVICEGNLHDPGFQTRLDGLVAKLTTLVEEPADNGKLTVDKVEPWNSVRVTLSIPKDAAVKLRKLAAEGNSALRALGILSVQLEGDTVLSLRLVGQEIVLRTDNSTTAGSTASGGANSGLGELTRILSQQQQQQQQQQQLQHGQPQTLPQDTLAGPSKVSPPHIHQKQTPSSVAAVPATSASLANGPLASESTIFKSPNTICPMDGKLPVHVPNVVESCEYPFESMTQARVIQRRENTLGVVSTAPGSSGVSNKVPSSNHFIAPNPPVPPAPPSYQAAVGTIPTVKSTSSATVAVGSSGGSTASSSGSVGNVAMTSPLLVNLLQNESVISQSLATGGSKSTIPTIKQELLTSGNSGMGSGVVVEKTTGIVGIASNSSKVNVINDNELSVNSGGLQKTSCIVTNSNNNNPVHPVIGNCVGGATVTVSSTTAAPCGIVSTHKTILVNNSTASVGAAGTDTASGPAAISASANRNPNNNNNIMTNTSNINNTASNNQNVLNVPPSLVTPPMSVPSSSKNVSVQQQQQQPRFNLGPSGAAAVKPSIQQHAMRPQQVLAVGMAQQQQRPSQHPSSQQAHSLQASLSRFPAQSQHLPFRQPSVPQAQQPNIVNSRWPVPQSMDSVTKSSYQEFTRYQMQYNLSQQQLSIKQPQQLQAALPMSGGSDLLGLSSLGDLPDFTKNDLDSLLPTLNSADLEGAFLDELDLGLEQSLTPTGSGGGLAKSSERKWKQQFLINPLTGELEETHVEETEENDEDASKSFPEFHSEMSNSLYSDDDTSCSTGFSKFTSDVSDTERSSTADGAGLSGFGSAPPGTANSLLGKLSKPAKVKKDKLKDGSKSSTKTKEKKPREKKSSSSLKQIKTKAKIVSTESGGESPGSQEKIKLRLKLEKSEAITVSLVQPQLIGGGASNSGGGLGISSINRKVQSSQVLTGTSGMGNISNSAGVNVAGMSSVQTSLSSCSLSSSTSVVSVGSVTQQQTQYQSMVSQQALGSSFTGTNHSAGINTSNSSPCLQTPSPAGEELRVPPLHISLRGKNSVVIKNSRKDRKKSQSGGEEDSDGCNFQLGKKSSIKRSSHSTDSRITMVKTSESSIRLKIEDSGSPAGPSSLPSSPNHHNHNSASSGGSSSMSMPIACGVSKANSNKLEDLSPSVSTAVAPALTSGDLMGFDQQHKRSASDSVHSPNGLMCPEKKRRLSTGLGSNLQSAGTVDELGMNASSNSAATSINEINEIYETLISSTTSGPIGSTNVGTLPQSSLLAAATSSAKNLKSSSTNNSINNNNAFGKCISSSSKNIVKPTQSSPTTSSVSSPGALASVPNTMSSTQSSKQHSPASPSIDVVQSGKSPPTERNHSDGTTEEQDSAAGDDSTCKNSSNTSTTTSGSEVSVNQRINNTHHHHHNRPPEQPGNSPSTSLDQSINQQQPAPTIVGVSNHLLTQGVRGSPGSQAQGEDSGIESMDALSEKSPHQASHSPQGNESNKMLRMDSPKDKIAVAAVELKEPLKNDSGNTNNNNSHASLDEYIDIEAALAKMEGLNELQVTTKLNGDHSTLMKPKQQELDLLGHNALLKLDSANLSKILDDIDDDELVMSDTAANLKGKSIEVSSSENSAPKQQESLVVKGEEAEDWLGKTGIKQQHQQQQLKGEVNDILTSSSNNNLTDKIEIKLDTKQLVLEDCCSNKEVLSLESECDSKIDDCKAVIKTDPEEAIVSSLKQQQSCSKGDTDNSSTSSNLSDTKPEKSACIDKGGGPTLCTTDSKYGANGEADSVPELKPRHEQPPLYSYSSEKARERRSAASSTSSSSSTATVVEIIDLDDSGKSNDLEPPLQTQPSQQIDSPLSIDIPLHPESAENRVRTRASSKLESPLEPPRQSPSIESPAAERLKNTLKHASTIANLTTTAVGGGGDRLSPKTLPKASKRKRQGSESSTQSCVSDDITVPTRAKKPRKAAVAAAAVTSAEKQKKVGASRNTQHRKAVIETPTSLNTPVIQTAAAAAMEDSSDSDEPLIEIAGTGSSASSGPATSEKEKSLRNHKIPSSASKTASSSGAQNSSSSAASSNSISLGSGVSNAHSHKSNAHSRSANSVPATPHTTSSTALTDEKISTRRSVRMTTSTLSTAAMNSKAKANASGSPTVTPNSISTGGASSTENHRESTHHHSASHLKINHVNHLHSSTTGIGKTSTSAATAEVKVSAGTHAASVALADTATTNMEVRRKTRSAGLESTTEGRRRRVSRDSK
ncbi:uncharacterized protein LOC131682072 isoform X2 [Topomyia yanbarensis]|uniref:uncharacterized protein LOC131682072 isoform X2 n=1 Tax=Topomyia yanbarensis TaxID=2498891 RepID=UPI00273CC4AF|nr:uncharacterized protein LOC131682072 isoform X2 [Topomyia yanbarensis]